MDRFRSEVLPVTVEWHLCAESIPSALWQVCFPPPIEGQWWYAALERSGLERQFQFAYAVLSCGGEALGIVPTFVMDMPLDIVTPRLLRPLARAFGPLFPALRTQRTFFVGSPCSEFGTVGLVPGRSLKEVLPTLQLAIEARARACGAAMLVWKDQPEAAAEQIRARGLAAGLFEVPSFPGTVLRVEGGTFESYLEQLPGRRRYRLRKKLALSRSAVALSVHSTQLPSDQEIDELYALYEMTHAQATVRFEHLTREFFREVARRGPAHFLILRACETGKAVAFMLFFCQDQCAINKFIGIDRDFHPEAYLYFRLWEAFVRQATKLGASMISSGQTSYRAKLDIGHELIPLANFSKHFNPLLHRFYAAIGRRITIQSLDDDLKTALDAAQKRVSRKGSGP
jgi:hypothetical protein